LPQISIVQLTEQVLASVPLSWPSSHCSYISTLPSPQCGSLQAVVHRQCRSCRRRGHTARRSPDRSYRCRTFRACTAAGVARTSWCRVAPPPSRHRAAVQAICPDGTAPPVVRRSRRGPRLRDVVCRRHRRMSELGAGAPRRAVLGRMMDMPVFALDMPRPKLDTVTSSWRTPFAPSSVDSFVAQNDRDGRSAFGDGVRSARRSAPRGQRRWVRLKKLPESSCSSASIP
jgi:hypothetical protein